MNPRTVDASQGWQWIVNGFAIFRKGALMWIAMTLLLTVMWLVVLIVPLIGPLLFNLVTPVFFAGILLGCRTVEQGGELELPVLFAGFKSNIAALITVGGVYLVGTIIIIGIVLITVGMSAFTLTKSGAGIDLDSALALLRSVSTGLLIAAALYIPLMMAIWFAPALIVFDNFGALDAMKLSFAACVKNMLPFLVYGLVVMVLWIIASIPLLLGLLILLPVLFCSVYTSYTDIFRPASGTLANPANSLLI